MKIYTVQRQDKFDYDFSVSLVNLGCYSDKAKAIARANKEYGCMQGEYEDEMLKYSDKDIYDPDEYSSGALYVETDDEDGYYGIVFNDHNISEAPGFTMAESFDMIIYNYHFVTEKNILIWDRHKVIKENGKVTLRTYIDTGGDYNEYDITLYRLSPETFLYLRGKHMTMSAFPSIGMSTPAFTYSNVAGGIGIIGSWWGTEMILKYTE